MKYTFALLVFSVFIGSAFGQFKIDGVIADGDDHSPLAGATIKLIPAGDSTKWQGTAADDSGRFEFSNLGTGLYLLEIKYIGYTDNPQRVFVSDADKHIGTVNMG